MDETEDLLVAVGVVDEDGEFGAAISFGLEDGTLGLFAEIQLVEDEVYER